MENDVKRFAFKVLGVQEFADFPLTTKPIFISGFWTGESILSSYLWPFFSGIGCLDTLGVRLDFQN